MAIAWKALPVWEKLDKVDRRINEMRPLVGEALAEVRMARQGHNLPQYLDQKLSGLESDLEHAVRRLKNRVESTRQVIPKAEVERERNAVPQVELQL